MIISKPKFQTLFSLITFLLICFSIAFYTGFQIFLNGNDGFFMNIGFGVFTALGIALTIKIIVGYKTIYLGKEKMDIIHLWGLKKKRYILKDVIQWFETTIKTYTGVYKELTLQFSSRKKLKITEQEHQSYHQVKRYLKKKFPSKEIQSPH